MGSSNSEKPALGIEMNTKVTCKHLKDYDLPLDIRSMRSENEQLLNLTLDPLSQASNDEPSSSVHTLIHERHDNGVAQPVQMTSDALWELKDLKDPVSPKNEISKSEILSILDQLYMDDNDFEKDVNPPELSSSTLLPEESLQHPLRKSSLDPVQVDKVQTLNQDRKKILAGCFQAQENISSSAPMSIMQISIASKPVNLISDDTNPSISPKSSFPPYKPLPPGPDPEPKSPFDFHRFLEQLRHRAADPVVKFLRSFLNEFSKKQWLAHEQVKIIADFLAFITNRMAQCEVWKGLSDAEFDNAKEGMEKLVMNRLYNQTFSPAISAPASIHNISEGKNDFEKSSVVGRRGQHQEDIERDEILGQKVRIYGWVEEKHLDIPSAGDRGKRFLALAQQGSVSYNVSATTINRFWRRAPQNQQLSCPTR